MTRCCAGPFGAVRPLDAPSELTALPRTTASTVVAVAPGVGQPLQQQHADAFAPPGAVGVGGERLAPAVRGEAALLANSTNAHGGRHHRRPARERERALATAQRLRREVHRDQRRRTRGVDRDRRAFQARTYTRSGRTAPRPRSRNRRSRRRPRHPATSVRVVLAVGAREHAGLAAAQGGRVDVRPARTPPSRPAAGAVVAGPSPGLRVARRRTASASKRAASSRNPPRRANGTSSASCPSRGPPGSRRRRRPRRRRDPRSLRGRARRRGTGSSWR